MAKSTEPLSQRIFRTLLRALPFDFRINYQGEMEGVFREQQREVRGEDDQVAVREIDEPHHPEDEREASSQEGVITAEQSALEECVEPVHRSPQMPK